MSLAKTEILIDVNTFETRVALLGDGHLVEVHLQRPKPSRHGVADNPAGYSLTGNIYRGRVERVVPGVQAAFVDIGLSRPGFLHVRDLAGGRAGAEGKSPEIAALVHPGQRLLVQVGKDPMNGKGTRLTANLALAERHLVLLPLDARIGVSRRIRDDSERNRLKTLVEAIRDDLGQSHGCVVRTVGETANADQLRADWLFLDRLWRHVENRGKTATRPGLVFEELPLPIRTVRDLADSSLEAIVVNDDVVFRRVADYVARQLPEWRDRVHRYHGTAPLFETRGVDAAIESALDRRAPLPSGGHLIVESTEAMTVIDVNSGSELASTSIAETALKTNLEAARAIPRQLRLRNIGGIVVVDFIDMEQPAHRDEVLAALVAAANGDPARFQASGFSPLGLVEISRRRTRESLLRQLCEPCAACDGRSFVKSVQSVCCDILRSVRNRGRRSRNLDCTVHAAEDVVRRLEGEDASHLAAVADQTGRPVRLRAEPGYRTDEYELVAR